MLTKGVNQRISGQEAHWPASPGLEMTGRLCSYHWCCNAVSLGPARPVAVVDRYDWGRDNLDHEMLDRPGLLAGGAGLQLWWCQDLDSKTGSWITSLAPPVSAKQNQTFNIFTTAVIWEYLTNKSYIVTTYLFRQSCLEWNETNILLKYQIFTAIVILWLKHQQIIPSKY